jgi:hypothetical protein
MKPCPKHPRYKAKKPPRPVILKVKTKLPPCHHCQAIWENKQAWKAKEQAK